MDKVTARLTLLAVAACVTTGVFGGLRFADAMPFRNALAKLFEAFGVP